MDPKAILWQMTKLVLLPVFLGIFLQRMVRHAVNHQRILRFLVNVTCLDELLEYCSLVLVQAFKAEIF